MDRKEITAVFLIFLVFLPTIQGWTVGQVAGATVGAGVAIVGAPFALSALGFGAGGIAAGSFGSWMMSTYGGAVAAGSAVATMQSAGAAGIATGTKVVLGAVGAAAGKYAVSSNNNKK